MHLTRYELNTQLRGPHFWNWIELTAHSYDQLLGHVQKWFQRWLCRGHAHKSMRVGYKGLPRSNTRHRCCAWMRTAPKREAWHGAPLLH